MTPPRRERRPQSERDALIARASVQWRMVKAMVLAYQEIGARPITEANQTLWKSKRETARSYLLLWKRTRTLLRGMGE